MVKGNKSFSAFKLFYDELIYKKSTSISYYKIERNINKIKEIVHCVLKTPISDEKYYMIKLERNHKLRIN